MLHRVPPVIAITDIAGLVKGAAEGAGLGNNFLSHIQAVDAIYHMVRGFDSTEVTHVEGTFTESSTSRKNTGR
jgi:obg-like ATPase 1